MFVALTRAVCIFQLPFSRLRQSIKSTKIAFFHKHIGNSTNSHYSLVLALWWLKRTLFRLNWKKSQFLSMNCFRLREIPLTNKLGPFSIDPQLAVIWKLRQIKLPQKIRNKQQSPKEVPLYMPWKGQICIVDCDADHSRLIPFIPYLHFNDDIITAQRRESHDYALNPALWRDGRENRKSSKQTEFLLIAKSHLMTEMLWIPNRRGPSCWALVQLINPADFRWIFRVLSCISEFAYHVALNAALFDVSVNAIQSNDILCI